MYDYKQVTLARPRYERLRTFAHWTVNITLIVILAIFAWVLLGALARICYFLFDAGWTTAQFFFESLL